MDVRVREASLRRRLTKVSRKTAGPVNKATPIKTYAHALPYVLSWSVLALLTIVGMTRLPTALYTPIDGDWAKWNVEAIFHFGKVFDLSPHSMLAGMGSTYFPNLPWLNPGALALALPIEDSAKDIVSYAIYAAELAASIVLLARVIGFSWLIATVAAQIYLYVLFPPFSEAFQTYNWFSLAPYCRTCDGGIECRAGIHPDVRSCPRLAIQPYARGRLLRAVHFWISVGAIHLHFCHACLCCDWCRAGGDEAPFRHRMGLEDGAAWLVPHLRFYIGPY